MSLPVWVCTASQGTLEFTLGDPSVEYTHLKIDLCAKGVFHCDTSFQAHKALWS